MVSRVDNLNSLLHVFNRNNGQDGTKNLVLHEIAIIGSNRIDDGRRHEEVLTAASTTDHNGFLATVIKQSLETVKLTGVDDATVRVGFLDIVSIEFLKGFAEGLDQFIRLVFGTKDIVGSDTGL
jgi:hypothetical protein